MRTAFIRPAHSLRLFTRRRQQSVSQQIGTSTVEASAVGLDESRPTRRKEVIRLRKRNWLFRQLLPPIVQIPGTGPVVLVDALGDSIADVIAALDDLPPRSIIATDDPDVGRLRNAGVLYEYLPPEDRTGEHPTVVIERLLELDSTYGFDEIRPLPE